MARHQSGGRDYQGDPQQASTEMTISDISCYHLDLVE
jgi:hypothetical protein